MAVISAVVLLLALQTTANPVHEPREGLENLKKDDLEENESIADHIYRVNREEHKQLFEGDIVLLENVDNDAVNGDESIREKRNAQRSRQYLWGNRVIPYDFDPNLPDEFQTTIQSAINEYHKSTCLKFVPRAEDSPNWIHFTHKSGCWSSVGKKYWAKGGQDLSLGAGCNHKGTVMHEMMHAIGFWHEQSRPDRSQYVEVLWENIVEGKEHNFNKYSHGRIDHLQVPYDFNSIMHYGKTSFSKNGNPTIRSIHDPDRELGQRSGFTEIDIHEINTLYDCSNNEKGWSSWSGYGACDKDCFKNRQRFCTSDNPDVDCPKHNSFGVETQTTKCSQSECNAAIDGHWGRWSSWSECSTTCGNGSQTRTRSCTDPKPEKGGKNCVGQSKMSQICMVKRCGLGPDDCQFDNDGFCFWENHQSERYFRWRRGSGSTSSSRTGPPGDHTTGSDHYIYVEASSPAQPGDKANLLSKTFPATSARCLSFWYHMLGSGIGDLSVYMKDSKTGALTKLWTKSGEQGNQWLQEEISIKSNVEYQIIFEAIRGSDFTGDTALDDVKFQDGLCPKDKPSYVKVGCFRDRKKPSRAIPMLKNIRGDIDWNDLEKTVEKCYQLAKQKNYKIFAIQFYGECRSGSEAEETYDEYGKVKDAKCPLGVGGPNVNAVYRIE